MAKKVHNRTDKDWEAIWDAETLARAELIKGDETRLAAAQKWAKELAEEEKAETAAMQKVANA